MNHSNNILSSPPLLKMQYVAPFLSINYQKRSLVYQSTIHQVWKLIIYFFFSWPQDAANLDGSENDFFVCPIRFSPRQQNDNNNWFVVVNFLSSKWNFPQKWPFLYYIRVGIKLFKKSMVNSFFYLYYLTFSDFS